MSESVEIVSELWAKDWGWLGEERCVELRVHDWYSDVPNVTLDEAEVRTLIAWLNTWLER
jgi:hypothetical protein